MDADLEAVRDRRFQAVQRFMDDNAAVFMISDAERERIHDDDPDARVFVGPEMIDGWLLIVRSVDAADPESESFLKVHSKGLTWSRQLGFDQWLRDALGMS